MIDKKIYKSKILALSLISSFLFLIATEAAPNTTDFDSDEEFKPVVRVKEGRESVTADQKDRFKRLIEEGKKLLQEEMNYEGAIRKFKEAKELAITRIQNADVFYHMSLAYYASQDEKGTKELVESIRKLIELDYYRELDELLCPPKYIELFQEIKKEYGALKVISKPAGADVYLNDSEVPAGKTPLTVGSKPGAVKVIIKRGSKVKKDILKVVAGKETVSSVYILKGISSLLYIVGGAVLAGSAGAVLLLKSGPGEEEVPAPTTGSIQVNSTPTGASIYLDGTDTGETTNYTLSNVSPGSHTVKLIKEGYEDYEVIVSVTAGQTATVNTNLTKIIITVTNPTSTSIWTKGKNVEIGWQTSGSSSFKAHASPGTRLNSLSYPGRNLSPSFQRRAFLDKRSSRNSKRARTELDSIDPSKATEISLNKSSEIQVVSKKPSSSGKKYKISHRRAENMRNIKNNNRFWRINLPFAPIAAGNSSISSKPSPQSLKPLGNIRALALTDVEIELYKADSLLQTITSSTENDGSYTWTVDEALEDGSDYKVRISSAIDSSIYGESSLFRIEDKSITVTEPTDSTVWIKGESANIIWTSVGTINNVKIDLYRGGALKETIVSTTPNDGSFTWTEVDPNLLDASNYSVRVSSVSDPEVYGESDRFIISVQRSITITEPTNGTLWIKGDPAQITWAHTGIIEDVKIELFKGSTSVKTIESNENNDGSYTWSEVESSIGDGEDYKIKIFDAIDSGIYGESGQFTISAERSITVTEPTSSTVWIKGNSAEITWTSTGVINEVTIDLYKESALIEPPIVLSTPNNGFFSWTVNANLVDGENYKLRVSYANDSRVYGETDEFTISAERTITVTEPTSSTVWTKGEEAEIKWSSTGVINNVKIELLKGSTVLKTIASATENGGSYTWTEVDPSLSYGTDYKVNISHASDPDICCYSPSFEIREPVPSAPLNLTAQAISASEIDLTWTDNSDNEDGFKIERKKEGFVTWSEITTVGANETTYENTGLEAATTYYYQVRAFNSGGNSEYSNEASATTFETIPVAPSGLTATADSSSQIDLSWTDNSDNEVGFKIERKEEGAVDWSEIEIVSADETTYENTGLEAATTYYYRVFAYNSAGNSGFSNEAYATTEE